MSAAVFILNGALHAGFALIFGALSLFAKRPQRRSIATNATYVTLITAAVSVVLAAGAGTFVRAGDGRSMYLAEWIGYTLSLYFIGQSLAETLAPDKAPLAARAGQALALVGAGCSIVLVLFMVVTLVFYVGPYMLGDVMNVVAASADVILAERWMYFAGNVLTKILLPIYELL
jgi:hypothetical protein